jgi:RimJ/RimL family protein N-acetyltransferase
MNVAELRAEHLDRLSVQPSQAWALPLLRGPGYVDSLLADGDAWVVEHGERVVAAGGIVRLHAQHGEAWTLIAPDAGPHMRRIHRLACEVLDGCPLRRVQAYADPEFRPAQRWLRMLGFELEGYCAAITPQGRDMLLFARIRT